MYRSGGQFGSFRFCNHYLANATMALWYVFMQVNIFGAWIHQRQTKISSNPNVLKVTIYFVPMIL